MRSANQKERVQKLRQGEGTFVYIGGACDTESVPGIPMLGPDGNQMRSVVFTTVEDSEGKKVQVVDPKSSDKGELVWKRAPQFKRIPLDVFKLRAPGVAAEHVDEAPSADGKSTVKVPSMTAKAGADGKAKALFLEFPKDKPVFVGDPRIALKLRCFPFFKEVEADGKKAKGEAKGEGARA
jgi:hypothetical protein